MPALLNYAIYLALYVTAPSPIVLASPTMRGPIACLQKNVSSRQQSPDAQPPDEPHLGGGDEPVEDVPPPAPTSKPLVEIHPLINGECIELQFTYQK